MSSKHLRTRSRMFKVGQSCYYAEFFIDFTYYTAYRSCPVTLNYFPILACRIHFENYLTVADIHRKSLVGFNYLRYKFVLIQRYLNGAQSVVLVTRDVTFKHIQYTIDEPEIWSTSCSDCKVKRINKNISSSQKLHSCIFRLISSSNIYKGVKLVLPYNFKIQIFYKNSLQIAFLDCKRQEMNFSIF